MAARRATLKKFREKHVEEILLHQAAKNAFDEMGVKKLPKVKELQTEYTKLLEKEKDLCQYPGVPRENAGAFNGKGQCGSGAEKWRWNRMLKKKKTTASGAAGPGQRKAFAERVATE